MYMLLAQPEWAAPLTTQSLRSDEADREAQVAKQLTEEISVLRTTIANLERELSEVKEAAAKRPVAIINRPQTTAEAVETQTSAESSTESAAVTAPGSGVAPEVPSEPNRVASTEPVTPTVLNAATAEQSLPVPKAEDEGEAPAGAVAPPPPVRKVTARNATSADAIAPPPARTAALSSNQDGQLALKMETGSLPARDLEITFGPPTVTPASEAFAIHLDAGPSLEALRLRWSLLAERHASTLRELEPRYVVSGPPTAPSYQLIAGPIASAEEASRVCALLRARRVQCTVGGPFVGEAL